MCRGRSVTFGGSGGIVRFRSKRDPRKSDGNYCMMTRSGRSFKPSVEMVQDDGGSEGVSELVRMLLEDRRLREEATARREAELAEERARREVELTIQCHFTAKSYCLERRNIPRSKKSA